MVNITKLGAKLIKKSDQLEKGYVFILDSIKAVRKDVESAWKQTEEQWEQTEGTLDQKPFRLLGAFASAISVLDNLIKYNPTDEIKEKLEKSRDGFISLKDSLIKELFKSLDKKVFIANVKLQTENCVNKLTVIIELISKKDNKLKNSENDLENAINY